MMTTGHLAAMNHQNEADLAILSHIRAMVETNAWIKRCHVRESEYIKSKDIQIYHYRVHLQDRDTWIQGTYEKNGKTVEMKVYYDDYGITAMDIDSH